MIVEVMAYLTNTKRKQLVLVQPFRLFDTRPGRPSANTQLSRPTEVPAGGVIRVPVRNRGGIPTSAKGVVITIAAFGPSASSVLIVYNCDQKRPRFLAAYFPKEGISSSLVAAPLSNAGDICVYTVVETHIVADIVGYMV